MTLSRARDPFAGINHWKRKHIPAATQICQHPTAGESGERAERERETSTRSHSLSFERAARQTESARGQRGRSVEGRRETERAARARKQTRNHDTAAAYGPLCCARCNVYTLSRERERKLASARERERERRVSERARWKAERNEVF